MSSSTYKRNLVDNAASFDVGLRNYMLGVYNYMSGGVALTAFVALFVASSPALQRAIFGTPLMWLVIFAPFVLVFTMGLSFNRLSVGAAQALFWGYAACTGLSLSVFFMVYTSESIARAFFISAAMFGAMSVWGYSTKRDLTAFGSFLFMGLIGLVIASLVNLFFASSALEFALSVIAVLVFTGLTAYDTKMIKETYFGLAHDEQLAKKMAVYGALHLYLDFINIFIAIMRLFGQRRQ